MAKTKFVEISNFTPGLAVLEDPTKAPLGSARKMVNAMISDKKGITKRPGTLLLGTENTNANGSKGFYNYVKSGGSPEILLKSYDDELEYYHPDLAKWARLEASFTVGSEFGFKEHLINTENEDYLYFGNRTEEYRRWSGAVTQLNGALSGGETTVVVDSVLKSDVYESLTASSVTTTTIDVTGTPWAASQWIDFYVHITSGAKAGFISKITANTNGQITFGTITGLTGTPTFEIRLAAFPASGTLVINNEELAYSALPEITKFTTSAVAGAHADNSPVTIKPTSYPANPKGNRLESHYTRMIVGNVRSALARDSGGTLQGSQSTGSYYVSKQVDATDFTFAATRAAGEGDVVSIAYGKGNITDIANQEDVFYVFKKNYIEGAKYSQDANDIIVREQLKTGLGSINRVIKGKDDIYFVTANNEFTSIGRVLSKDTKPQSLNIGLPIKRLLDDYDFGNTEGGEWKNRILVNGKASSDDSNNNRILILNGQLNTWEGVWYLSAHSFREYSNKFYMAESHTPNVLQMFVGENDVRGSNVFGITTEWLSNWLNLTASNFNQQAIEGVALAGEIRSGTEITMNIYKDWSSTPFLSITFNATDEPEFLTADNFAVFLGGAPLATEPMGSITEADADGKRHFEWQFYFPPQYGTHFSFGFTNSGKSQYFDITRTGLALSEDVDYDQNKIKTS